MNRTHVAALDHRLAREFAISRDATTSTRVVHLRLDHAGTVGWGEAAASPAVTGETADQALEGLQKAIANGLDASSAGALSGSFGHLGASALAAVDLAIYDVAGRARDVPAHELLGLPTNGKATTCTVSLGPPAQMADSARAWCDAGAQTLKLKLGGPEDDIARVRAVMDACPGVPLTVDANEAWPASVAPQLAGEIVDMGVILVEQPVARDDLDALGAVADVVDVPVVADEAITTAQDIDRLAAADVCDGVNVKVQKVGGMLAARTCIEAARDHGLKVLVGCNLETGLGIAAGATLAGVADWLDLDAHLLLADDPFSAPWGPGDEIRPTGEPGLGLEPSTDFLSRFEDA